MFPNTAIDAYPHPWIGSAVYIGVCLLVVVLPVRLHYFRRRLRLRQRRIERTRRLEAAAELARMKARAALHEMYVNAPTYGEARRVLTLIWLNDVDTWRIRR